MIDAKISPAAIHARQTVPAQVGENGFRLHPRGAVVEFRVGTGDLAGDFIQSSTDLLRRLDAIHGRLQGWVTHFF